MSGADLSREVLEFIGGCIDSVEQLRVLLLMHSQPERAWSTAEMTAELRSSEQSIVRRIEGLYARGVLRRPPAPALLHKYDPCTVELRAVIGELARENEIRPYRIIEAIYSQPNRVLMDFADAFRFKGGKS